MIAVRLLTHKEVAGLLARFDCEYISTEVGSDDYYAYSYWRTSWGFHFTVPLVGPDRLCPEHRLYSILAELGEQAPENNG